MHMAHVGDTRGCFLCAFLVVELGLAPVYMIPLGSCIQGV